MSLLTAGNDYAILRNQKHFQIHNWGYSDVITEADMDALDYKAICGGNSILIQSEEPGTEENTNAEEKGFYKETNKIWIDTSNDIKVFQIPAMDDLERIVASKYSIAKNYTKGDYVFITSIDNENEEEKYHLYRATTDIQKNQIFSFDNWTEVNITSLLQQSNENLAPIFREDNSYNSGDYLTTTSNKFYHVYTDTQPNTTFQNITAKVQTNIGEELSIIKHNLIAESKFSNLNLTGIETSTDFIQGQRVTAYGNIWLVIKNNNRCTSARVFKLKRKDTIKVSGNFNGNKILPIKIDAITNEKIGSDVWTNTAYTYTATQDMYMVFNVATANQNDAIKPSDFSLTITQEDHNSLIQDSSARLNDLSIMIGMKPINKSELGYYLDLSGTRVNINNPQFSSDYNYTYSCVSCSEGDIFTINALGNTNSGAKAWPIAFLDANYNIIQKIYYQNVQEYHIVLTAPANSAYLIINDRSGEFSYYGQPAGKIIKEMNDTIDNILKELYVYESVEWSDFGSQNYPFGWAPGYYSSTGAASDSNSTYHNYYLRTRNASTGYIRKAGAAKFIIEAPAGYSIKAYEYDGNSRAYTGRSYGTVGVGNTVDSALKQTNRLILNFQNNNFYKLHIGTFNNNADTFLTENFINQIHAWFLTPSSSNGIIRDIPENRGVLNAYKKARQLIDLQFTAKAPMVYNVGAGLQIAETGHVFNGMIYSSAKEYDKYITYNTSLRTFMTAVNNEHSVVYTENTYYNSSASAYHKRYYGGRLVGNYYGTVCSAFVSHALGLNFMAYAADMVYLNKIGLFDKVYGQTVQDLKLMDVIWVPGHVRLVSDIYRDMRGKIVTVHILEGTYPTCQEVIYSDLEGSSRKLSLLTSYIQDDHSEPGIIYRYKYLYTNINYTQSPFVTITSEGEQEDETPYAYNDTICTYLGDYPAIAEHEDMYINFNKNNTYNRLVIATEEGQIINTLDISDSDNTVKLDQMSAGFYKAYLTSTNDNSLISEPTHWQVIDTNVSVSLNGTNVHLTFSSTNAIPINIRFARYDNTNDNGASYGTLLLSDTDLNNGYVDFDYVEQLMECGYNVPNSKLYAKVNFKGEYGTVRCALTDCCLIS